MMNDSARRVISRLLIGAIVFAQLAVAAYACPGQSAIPADDIATATVTTMGMDCDHMREAPDASAPSLCAAHCHNHEQSADHAAAPDLPPALFSTLYWLAAATPVERASAAPCDVVLRAALSPPHAILHCCFRI